MKNGGNSSKIKEVKEFDFELKASNLTDFNDRYSLFKILKFELINRKGKTTLRFSQKDFPLEIAVDFLIPFDPYYPRQVRIVDNKGRETIMLIDEYQLL